MKNNFLYFIPQNMPFNLYCLCPKRCAPKHAQACRLKNYSHFGILLVSFLRNVKYLNASHKNQMVTMVNFCAISWKTQDNALMAKNHSTNFHLPLALYLKNSFYFMRNKSNKILSKAWNVPKNGFATCGKLKDSNKIGIIIQFFSDGSNYVWCTMLVCSKP